jgi:hypothetical protein
MRTYLEALKNRPRVQSNHVVDRSFKRHPRVKTNADGTLTHVRSSYIQSNRLWLIVITYIPKDSFRVRVWLRPDLDVPIMDRDGLRTINGAEWSAFAALQSAVLRFNKADEETVGSHGGKERR